MNVEVQADSEGTLRFVAPGKGTIATLSYEALSILHSLSRMGFVPVSPVTARKQAQQFFGGIKTITVHMMTRTIPPSRTPPGDLFPIVRRLEALQLVSTSTRRQTVGLTLLGPYAPIRLTRQGRRLLRWLRTEWEGWPAYARQFPL